MPDGAVPDGAVPDVLHVAIVPVAPARHEPAHEHADIRYLLATDRPDTARPENPVAALRWLSLAEAYAATTRPNLRETLRRVESRFA